MLSHCKPQVSEQRIIVMGKSRIAIEFVIVGVLQPNPSIGPWPKGRRAGNKWDVGEFKDHPVAVGIILNGRGRTRIELTGQLIKDGIR